MMKNLEELYQDLEKYRDFDEDDNTERFLDTADAIALKKDPSSIPILLSYFNENTEYSWVMSSLMSIVEYYDVEDYVKSLLKNMNIMLPQGLEYLQSLLFHLLNTPADYEILIKNLHLAPKDSLLKVLNLMEIESPYHHHLIARLKETNRKT